MTARYSTAVRNFVGAEGSYDSAWRGGKILIYSGSQPASADHAPTGTLLVTITDASGSHTDEVRATGSVELTGGGSGSVDGITVDGIEIMSGAEAFDTSLTVTAANVAANINAHQSFPNYTATSAGAVVTIRARRGLGTEANGYVVTSSTTTITTTDTNLSSGVDSANGLKFATSASGVLAKLSSQTWSGVTATTGTAGWFRFVGAIADSGVLDSSATEIRLDGAVSTSGSQLNMSSTAFTASAVQTVTSFNITLPAA